MMNSTLAHYDRTAAAYAEQSFDTDVSELRQRFLDLLPVGAQILDAGCGSGRDALAFANAGFDVTACDGSAAMVIEARARTGLDVEHVSFQGLPWVNTFDGVWTCASLLHVPVAEEWEVLTRIKRALVPGGVWYLCFKQGEGERMEGERLFRDHTTASLRELIAEIGGLEIIDLWTNGDAKRAGLVWVNAFLRKTA